MGLLQPASSVSRALKAGLFGGGGSGKTLTATLIAIGLSKKHHGSAPIAFFDTEDQSDFIAPICAAENVPLFVTHSRSFIDMRDTLKEAAGSCCALIVDSYSHPVQELEESLKRKTDHVGRRLQYYQRQQLFMLWGEWVRDMRASPLHVLLNGRLSFEWDEVEDDEGDARAVKVGTKMRGDSDAGYEPDLLVELEAVRDSLVRNKTTKTKRGNMKHAAVILKDRWMALNGKTFVWPDINDYQPGDYELVFKAFLPHLERLNIGQNRPVMASRSSESLFSAPSGESAFAARSRRVAGAWEEISGAMSTIWPGSTNDEKKLRAIVLKTLFASRSESVIKAMAPEMLESAWAVMQHFEAAVSQINRLDESAVIDLIQSCKDLERQSVEDMVT